MTTIAITGSASGIGAATASRLADAGHRVITVDLHDADIEADLSQPDARVAAIRGVLDASDGVLGGLVTYGRRVPVLRRRRRGHASILRIHRP
jgi:NAD(P)-dependent dehydrogenase (short-subunit alcohol dehydrogenase family)